MNRLSWLWLLLLSELLSGSWCHAQRLPPPADTAAPPSRVYHDVYSGPRRLRGTIGKQAVTLELDATEQGYAGGYYYDRLGQWQEVRAEISPSAGTLRLCETPAGDLTGRLKLPSRIAAPLKGSWESATGRYAAAFELRETYVGAARYQQELWEVWRYATAPDTQGIALDSAFFHQLYITVSLPKNPGAEQRLRRALAAPFLPETMPLYLDSLLRAQQQAQPGYQFHGASDVVYNGGNLLSVLQVANVQQGPDYQPHEWYNGSTYDLGTGRRLPLASLLRPGYQKRLAELRRRRLALVLAAAPADGPLGELADEMPVGGFTVVPLGLAFTYDDRDAASLSQPGLGHPDRALEIVLPYEELLPLIRPDGPLAPVLRARGLLPKK